MAGARRAGVTRAGVIRAGLTWAGLTWTGLTLATATFSGATLAQSFPVKPVRIVVPFAPGGVDITARLLQPRMQEDLGQPIVIENRPGAGGVTGSVAVSKSPPDGYTLLMTASGTLISTPLLASKPAFDPINDFSPITVVFQAVSTLVVNAALPVNSVKELIDYARRNPGKLGFASPGIGTAAAEWLARQDPMLVGSDNSAVEISPNPNRQLVGPVHQIMLVVNGIHLLENLRLDELAATRTHEFALIVEPLKIQGGTGSTVAPVAVR